MLQWPGSLQPGFKSPPLPKVVKISSYIQIFPIYKRCMLPNCITNLHVGSVKLKQMYISLEPTFVH